MTPPQSPEWLEPNEDSISHRNARRRLPVLALSAAFTLIGAGAIFAQPQVVAVANTGANADVVNTAQLDSNVTPSTLNLPVVSALTDDEVDFNDVLGFDVTDDDESDDDESDDDESDDDESDDDESDDDDD